MQVGTKLNVIIAIYPKDDNKYDDTQELDLKLEIMTFGEMWNGMNFTLQVI